MMSTLNILYLLSSRKTACTRRLYMAVECSVLFMASAEPTTDARLRSKRPH